MNKEILQTILNRLDEIKKGLNIDANKGICYNLFNYTYDHNKTICNFVVNDDWLYNQFYLWPECHARENGHKDIVHPIGGCNEYKAERIQDTVWDNPRRLQLLDFLIEQATQELKQMN